jgi:hypothetical protein
MICGTLMTQAAAMMANPRAYNSQDTIAAQGPQAGRIYRCITAIQLQEATGAHAVTVQKSPSQVQTFEKVSLSKSADGICPSEIASRHRCSKNTSDIPTSGTTIGVPVPLLPRLKSSNSVTVPYVNSDIHPERPAQLADVRWCQHLGSRDRCTRT